MAAITIEWLIISVLIAFIVGIFMGASLTRPSSPKS